LSADGGWQRKAEVVDVRNRSSVGVQCEKQCRRVYTEHSVHDSRL